ncbi:ABC transporter permease [candidate division KSB1 bacterium]
MEIKSSKKPRILFTLLKHLLLKFDKDPLYNHFEQLYEDVCQEKGKFRANIWIWNQFFRSLPGLFSAIIYWRFIMFKSYVKIAVRNIKRHKAYSVINISGLAVGMAVCILIFLWVQYETGFDSFHNRIDSIYRVIVNKDIGDHTTQTPLTPSSLGLVIKENFPEVEEVVRLTSMPLGYVKHGDKGFFDIRCYSVEPSFFRIFSFSLITGDPESILSEPYSIVLSEQTVKKYFNDENPIGKILTAHQREYKITGIMKDIPGNSHLQFDCLIPFRDLGYGWEYEGYNTYILLKKGINANGFVKKIEDIYSQNVPGSQNKIYLQALSDIHFNTNIQNDEAVKFDKKYVQIFSLIAIFVLIIACINYMNLSTARSLDRAKEVGLRKVIGAKRKDIIRQFFGETIFISFAALGVAIVLVLLFLPAFNNFTLKELSLTQHGNLNMAIIFILFAFFTGIVSGSYPAIVFSSFKPAAVLRGIFFGGEKVFFKKILVFFQFSFSVFLIISAVVVYKQMHFIKNKALGYEKENIIIPQAASAAYAREIDIIRDKLLKNPNILGVTRGFHPVYQQIMTSTVTWEGKTTTDDITVECYNIDYDYIDTYQMNIIEGRNYSRELTTDAANFLINEEAAGIMGLSNPVGKRIKLGRQEGEIIGLVENFHHGSFHNKIRPVVMKLDFSLAISIKLSPNNLPETIAFVKKVFEEIVPEYPFRYRFLDDILGEFYKTEKVTSHIFNFGALLAVFISFLGLFGMVSFTLVQRTKEIGIRKILGASIKDILILLSKEFLILVFAANIFAWSVGYITMKNWLQNFAYRTGIYSDVFIFAGVITMIITLFTVSFQSLKKALNNPIDSLRDE